MKRVACPRQTGSTPSAIGSSVPACPTRFTRVMRRTARTTSIEVMAFGLLMTNAPSASTLVVVPLIPVP